MESTEVTVDQVRAEWDAAASGWTRHGSQLADHTRPVRDRIVALLAATPGDTVLDLAAGLGEISRELVAEVGPEGRVICSDVAPRMVEAVRRRSPDAVGLDFRVLDTQQLDLSHGHAPSADPAGPGGVFSLSAPDTVQDLLRSGGFEHVHVEAVDVPLQVPSFEVYWQLRAATSGPLRSILQRLDAPEVALVRSSCEEYSAHLRAPDGSYTFPGRALVMLGR